MALHRARACRRCHSSLVLDLFVYTCFREVFVTDTHAEAVFASGSAGKVLFPERESCLFHFLVPQEWRKMVSYSGNNAWAYLTRPCSFPAVSQRVHSVPSHQSCGTASLR